jgi:hypothetical protein
MNAVELEKATLTRLEHIMNGRINALRKAQEGYRSAIEQCISLWRIRDPTVEPVNNGVSEVALKKRDAMLRE